MTDETSAHFTGLHNEGRRVRIDSSRAKSSYCNVCNVSSTKEEVVLNFGLNQSWDRPDDDLEIELHHRVIMSPYAARKMHRLLGSLLEEHQSRHGSLAD